MRYITKALFVGFGLIVLLKFGVQSYPIAVGQYVEVLQDKLPTGVEVHFSKPVLTWDFWLRPFEVAIHDVRLCQTQDKDGRCVLASRLGVMFSLWSLIRHQKLVPASFRIDNLAYDKRALTRPLDPGGYKLTGPKTKTLDTSKALPWWQTYRDPCTISLVGGDYELSFHYAWSTDQIELVGRGKGALGPFVRQTSLAFLEEMSLKGQFEVSRKHNASDWLGTLSVHGRSRRKQKLMARIALQPKQIVIEKAFFRGPLLEAGFEGQVALDSGNKYDYALFMTTLYMPFRDVLKAWPLDQGKNARNWLAKHVMRGDVQARVSLKGRLSDLVAPTFRGVLRFQGLDLVPVDGFVPIKDASGRVDFDAEGFNIRLDKGHIRGQKLRQGRVRIEGLAVDKERIDISADLVGDIQDALFLISRDPFDYLKKVHVPLDRLKGEVATRIHLKFPLTRHLKRSDVVYDITADVTNASYTYSLPFLSQPLNITQLLMNLSVASSGLKIEGQGVCLGQTLALSFQDAFQGNEATSLTLKTVMTQRHLDLMPESYVRDKLTPPFNIQIVYSNKTPIPWHVEADWTRSTLSIRGLKKDPGVPAFLNFDLDLTKDALFKNIRATIGGIEFVCDVTLDKGGDLSDFHVKAVQGGRHDWTLKGQSTKNGLTLDVQGRRLDGWWLVPLLSGSGDNPTEASSKDPKNLHIKANLERLDLVKNHHHPLLNVRLDTKGVLQSGDIAFNTFSLTAKSLSTKKSGRGTMTIDRLQDGKDIIWQAKATKAGYFLEGLGLVPNIHEGQLALKLTAPHHTSKFSGTLWMDNFSIKRTPFLQRFFMTFLSFPGFMRLLTGDHLFFSDLKGHLVINRGVMDIERLKMEGDTTLIMQGWVDLKRERVNIHGDLIPAYFLNRFLTNIPLVGPVVFGGKDDGLLATRFYVEGPFSDLKVKANPFQMLTPGLFKRQNRILENESLKKSRPKR